MIEDASARNPDGLALTDGTRSRSWSELVDRVNRLARLLRGDLGLAEGDHAGLLMGNRVEFVEISLAALRAGVWLTPVSRHLKPEEIAYIIQDSGARVVFADPEREQVARAAGAPELILAGESLDAAMLASSDEPMSDAGPPGGTMIYTSGTTGRPKGVKRGRVATLAQALAAQGEYGRAMGLDGSGPHLITGPLYHAAPLGFAIYDQANGARVVIMPSWDESKALTQIEEQEIRHTHMVPTMFVRLLRLPEEVRSAFSTSHLDLVLHGAAPVAPVTKRRMIDWWGPILVEYWGGTEGGVNTLVGSADWLAHPGTVGRPVRGFEIFAVDDDGEPLPGDTPGVLYARHESGQRTFEYHGDREKTDAAHLACGAFTLGDIGSVDSEGWVHLMDRKSNLVISGGVNIYPAEVEQTLLEHPAVADVGVFGIPDDEWGESLKAAVELVPGKRPGDELAQDILSFARRMLAGYKVPRSIDFETQLPRNPTGKLLVRELREPYWKGREKRI